MNKLILVILMLALLLGIQLKQNIAGGSLTYYSTESSVLYGTEITNHTLSHASDDKWYQVNSEKISSGAYVFSVVLDFSTNHAPSTLTQIGIFVEAHVNVKISANVMIYNFKEAIHGSHWVSLFQITNTTDTQFTWSTLANAPSFMNETGHVLLKFYYENFWAQTLFLDLAYITISVKLPTARFSYFPLNPLAYETVTFNASKSTSSGKITAYIWDFGDGTNGTGMLTTHEYHVHGNYTVSLTVTDSDGLSASTSTVIFVSEHDIAIYGLEYSPQEVYRCMIVTIVLTIKNEGTFHESFNATVYYGSDNIAVETKTILDLAPDELRNVTFLWDTENIIYYIDYTIAAKIDKVPSEIDTADNIAESGAVHIRMIGDTNDDGIVDPLDLGSLGAKWGAFKGEPRYDWQVDFNGDGRVDPLDLGLLGSYWGKTREDDSTKTVTFQVSVDSTVFYIITVSNSTVSNMTLNESLKQLSFYVTGPSATIGYCEVTFPQALLGGPYTVTIDGMETKQWLIAPTYPYITFKIYYSQSTHIIAITGATIYPNVPTVGTRTLPLLFTDDK